MALLNGLILQHNYTYSYANSHIKEHHSTYVTTIVIDHVQNLYHMPLFTLLIAYTAAQ